MHGERYTSMWNRRYNVDITQETTNRIHIVFSILLALFQQCKRYDKGDICTNYPVYPLAPTIYVGFIAHLHISDVLCGLLLWYKEDHICHAFQLMVAIHDPNTRSVTRFRKRSPAVLNDVWGSTRVIKTMPADDRAPLSPKTSPGTMLTKFGSYMYVRPQLDELT